MPGPRRRPRDDDDDDFPTRPRKLRRRSRGSATPWVLGGLGLGLAVMAAVVAYYAVFKSTGGGSGGDAAGGGADEPDKERVEEALAFASPFNPPETWTLQDLAEHFRAKGLPVTIRPAPTAGKSFGEAVYFEDARPNVTRRGKIRVFRCASKRDAAKQIVLMKPERYLPRVVGHFAIGHDGREYPADEDLEYGGRVKSSVY